MNLSIDDDIISECYSPLLHLPLELWYKIFSYLKFTDFCQARLVSRKFLELSLSSRFNKTTQLVITQKNCDELRKFLENSLEIDYWMFRKVQISNINNLNVRLLMKDIGHNVQYLHLFESPIVEILQNLTNLTELIISGIVSFPCDNIEYLEFPPTIKSIIINTVSSNLKIRVLEHLLKNPTKYKLERLEIGNLVEQERMYFQILDIHKSTLKHLSLFYYTKPNMEITSLQHIFQDMSHLQTIQLIAECPLKYISDIICFLPKTAPIKFLILQGTLKMNNDIVTQMLKKWPKTIKHLDLGFTGLESNNCLNELSEIRNNLKILDLSFCSWVKGAALIKGLCSDPNYVLSHLFLNDLDEIEEQYFCIIIERLPNLIALSLENCRKGVTNETLAKIFQHQIKLQTLILNDCYKITDSGLVGFGENPYAVSRLKGLRKLGLRGCMKISDLSLLNGLIFKELRSLKLGYCYKITNDGFAALIKNCPTVESLILSSCKMVNDETVYMVVIGLKRLLKLNLSNCINISDKSLDYIIEHCNLLQKLIIFGLESVNLDKIQQLKKKQPYLKRLQF